LRKAVERRCDCRTPGWLNPNTTHHRSSRQTIAATREMAAQEARHPRLRNNSCAKGKSNETHTRHLFKRARAWGQLGLKACHWSSKVRSNRIFLPETSTVRISPGSRSLVRAAETVNTSRFVKRLADGRPQTAINFHPEVTEFSANAGCTIAATEDSLLTKPHRNQCAEDGVLEGCFDGSSLAFGGFAFFICSPRSWT
jgi:hypothetical protein